ncbi:MAG TPA: DUF4349 domain-containing protein [Candidatus Bathyarchaeia archaeon]|nr:DUF4349 domain-containing protein [Candidatus Bathyarchaeia archaeon]
MLIWEWVKRNKLTVLLLLVIAYLIYRGNVPRLTALPKAISPRSTTYEESISDSGVARLNMPSVGGGGISSISQSAPTPEVKDRLVVEESYVSMLVKDVRQKVDEVIDYTQKEGGYMVSSNISQPEEAPFATVVLRLPSAKLKSTLDHLRTLAVKVTSENLQGWDVTDQYVDLEARLQTLEKTKAKFEEILNKAEKVDEILQVQRELINIQEQIDSLKGRQDYLKKTAENAKLTVYLSSDEWALPYAPAKPFRPNVIFKQAVRSLVMTLRGLAKLAIWLVVYSVIFIPVYLIFRLIKKRREKVTS